MICSLSFTVSSHHHDPAIRHENGKQVARWNVEPPFHHPASSHAPHTSSGTPGNPHEGPSGYMPQPGHLGHIAGRTLGYITGQPQPSRHPQPNGKSIFVLFSVEDSSLFLLHLNCLSNGTYSSAAYITTCNVNLVRQLWHTMMLLTDVYF